MHLFLQNAKELCISEGLNGSAHCAGNTKYFLCSFLGKFLTCILFCILFHLFLPYLCGLDMSLITRWRFLVSSICVIWVFLLHFTSIKRYTKSSVIFLQKGVLSLNWKKNRDPGPISLEIRTPRKKNKEYRGKTHQ